MHALVACGLLTIAAQAPAKPNFILILCDNLGYGDVGCYGSKLHKTPHIDRLAAEGMRLTAFYATSGVCTPSRASLMTGCYPRRVGLHKNARGGAVLQPVEPIGLHPDEITIAEVLKGAGYVTALIGKWHLGDQPSFLPTRQGFDQYLGIPYSDDMTPRPGQPWPDLPLLRGEKVIEAPVDRNTLTRRYTEEAIRFITDNRDRPFFLLLSHAMPGSTPAPFASERFRGKSANGPWGDSVEEIDWSTGEILGTLARLDLDRRTCVVWTSDNGAPRRNPPQGSNLPLGGWGYTTAEGGMRMPCLVRWPGQVPKGATSSELTTMMDWLPTFAGRAGVDAPRERAVDGKDIWPILAGQRGATSPHAAFFCYHMDQLQAVRSGPWKLYLPLEKKLVKLKGETAPAATQLFDVLADPGETKNLAERLPKVVAQLTAHAEKARADLGDIDRPGAGQRPPGRVGDPQPLELPRSAKPQAAEAPRGAKRRPNLVVIMTDNQGAWTLGCYGNPDIRTPHIDRLAAAGMRFERCFSSNAVCSPTRATFFTGLLPSQHGVHTYLRAGEPQIGPGAYCTIREFRTLPRILAGLGYVCGLVGKWHLGDNLNPQEGFSYWVTTPHGHTTTFYNAEVIEDRKIRKEPRYLTDFWTDHGCKFIEQNRERPFFLCLTYNGPYGLGKSLLEPARNRHADYYAGKEMKSFPRLPMHPWLFNNKEYLNNVQAMRRYAAEVSGIDDGVGRIVELLQKLGLERDTLVVFTADQGLGAGQHGIWGMGDHTRPLHAFDETVHVPLIFRHPGQIAGAKTSDLLVSNYDLLPTLLDALGEKDATPTKPASPGRSFAAVLRGGKVAWENVVFYEFENTRAIRTAEWKFIQRFPAGPDELYDLARDPGQLKNLIGQAGHAPTQERLRRQLAAFFERYADPRYDLWRQGGSQAPLLTRPPAKNK
jgi:arylsulfatase A-like enzyme